MMWDPTEHRASRGPSTVVRGPLLNAERGGPALLARRGEPAERDGWSDRGLGVCPSHGNQARVDS